MKHNKKTLSFFISSIAGLLFLFIYFLFGCEKFEPKRVYKLATLTTTQVTDITDVSAVSGGNITSDGGSAITERGIWYDLSKNPELGGMKVQSGNGSGAFTSKLTGLEPETEYFVKAYAINETGTAYGNELTFQTGSSPSAPSVTTTAISAITDSSALSGGTIINPGSDTILACGVCWSTTQNPTIADSITIDTLEANVFLSALTNLTPNTEYFVRAYATNSTGTDYGYELDFTTSASYSMPTVIVINVSNITASSANVLCEVTSDGGSEVSERGLYHGTATNPETTGTKLQIGSGTGTFSTSLTGLIEGTTYYVKAYAINSVGTAYSNEVSFTTLGGETVTDYDGNIYQIITIGTQTWMAENIKTTHFANGEFIPLITDNATWTGSITGAYCWYNNNETTYKDIYGALYNWYTVVDGRSVCPTGWKVPSDSEWTTLITFIGGANIAGGKLKEAGTSHWNGLNADGTDEFGFTALPGGFRLEDGNYDLLGDAARFWTSMEENSAYSKGINIDRYSSEILNYSYRKKYGFSIRCIKGNPVLKPIVNTNAILNINETSATVGGDVTSDGGDAVTGKGIYYGTSTNPETTGTKLQIGSGTGTFSTSLTGLIEGTTYYVKAYAINSVGTAYGNEVSFTTASTITIPSLTTTSVSSITGTTAESGGSITDDGGAAVAARGVCWNTIQNPTTTDNLTLDGSGTGTFASIIADLTSNTTYYVRAYATNSAGTAYGNERSFTTATIPSVTTISVSSITGNTSQSGGSISDDGGLTIIAKGVCWSTSQNPTLVDFNTNDGTGIGAFISNLTNLTINTTYYVRAYATNGIGTAYGNQLGFTTDDIPTLTTIAASSITENSAQSGGNITNDGGAPVTARGVCWSTSSTPTTADNYTNDGTGIGVFISNLTNLTINTTYYVRAYATNGIGTAYGNQLGFTTDDIPTLTTIAASSITENSAQSGGNITNDGGAPVTARGVCWSTSSTPTTADSYTNDGSGSGSFTSNITGLAEVTTYYIRAYATNSIGTSYGEEDIFTTLLADYDGNVYNTVHIGNQHWMTENLKVTHFADGTAITLVEGDSEWAALGITSKAYCYNINSTFNIDTYGALYTWGAAMNGTASSSSNPSSVQGVCPDGWHLPSDAEWKELEMFLGMSQTVADSIDCRGTDEGGKLKETGIIHWNNPNDGATNSSGFTALAGGSRYFFNGWTSSTGYNSHLWSSTESSSTEAWSRTLGYNYSKVCRNGSIKYFGYSVRCLRDK